MNPEQLNDLVKATKLKVGELESKLGISQGDLSKIRKGTRQLKPEQEDRLRELAGLLVPTVEVLTGRRFIALCNRLNVGIEEMFLRLENPPEPVPVLAPEEKQHPKPKMINL